MKFRQSLVLSLAALVVLASGFVIRTTTKAKPSSKAETKPSPATPFYGMSYGAPDLKSAGSLAFGPDGVLFVADSQNGAVFALDVKETGKDEGAEKTEVRNIDQKLASLLGVAADQVVINDLVVNQNSQNAYLSVSRGRGNAAVPVIVKVTKKGALEEVSLAEIRFSKHVLADLPAAEAKTSWGESKRKFAITDLAFVDGQVLVAGLSNEEFSSTLRRVAFPFAEKTAATTLEIYHASHNRYETQSPIETFLPFKIKGQMGLLAGYGCAPLVSFSMSELTSKKHLRGTTLAELGGGNRPLDMISFQRDGKERVLIANSSRTLMSISAEDIDRAQPVTTPVAAAYVTSGVPYVSVAEVGVTQLDNLNSGFVLVVQRDINDGSLNLRSLSKRWL